MKRIVIRFHDATACLVRLAGITALAGFVLAAPAAVAEPIRGAGSTFAAPIIARWAQIYEAARRDGGDFSSPDWTVDYELVGSLAGLMRLDQSDLDFAATDVPLSHAELAKHGRQQFPIVLGSVAVAVNLDNVEKGGLKLTGELLADIYLGKIASWSDPAIKTLNPGLALPDLKITPLTRKDGSGTTFIFTEFLSAKSAEWKATHGADTLIKWPVGTGFEGTGDLVNAVKATKGAITYADFGQVERAQLPFASILNKSGEFVRPGPEGVRAAVAAAKWDPAQDFNISLTDQPASTAYPITGATFAVLPVRGRSSSQYGRVHDFFRLAFETGSKDAEALGYVPLPPQLSGQVVKYWLNHDPASLH